MKNLITLALIGCALIWNNNSCAMLRALTQQCRASSAPKYARPIVFKLTPEQVNEGISEAQRVDHWYQKGLERNKSLSPQNTNAQQLLKTQTSLIKNIQQLNNENLKILKEKNSTQLYEINDFTQQLDLLTFLEDELEARGLFSNQ